MGRRAAAGGVVTANSYVRSDAVFDEGAVVTTDDTVLTGFGVEGIAEPAMRVDFLSRALTHLLD